jgi:hypothetical protein
VKVKPGILAGIDKKELNKKRVKNWIKLEK